MGISSYIWGLLLIAPGFLADYLNGLFTQIKKNNTDFEKALVALNYSLIINAINFCILMFFFDLNDVKSLISNSKNTQFIVIYILLTLIVTFMFSKFFSYILVKVYSSKNFLDIMVKPLGIPNKYISLSNPDVWTYFLNDESEDKIISIHKNGQEIGKGFVESWSLYGSDEKEILLNSENVFKENNESLLTVKRTYYNLDKDLIIKEYILKEDEEQDAG